MVVMVDARFRAKVLVVAAGLTSDRDCAAAVAVNASPLLAWLEGAVDEDDMRARWRAMFQHHQNTMSEPRDDNPERFLAQARTLYAFMTAGSGDEAPVGDAPGRVLDGKLRRLRELSQGLVTAQPPQQVAEGAVTEDSSRAKVV